MINYSFELHDFNEALTPYGIIETKSPELTTLNINDFTDGDHFRTAPEDITKSLVLKLDDRILTILLDRSGSMTWNDITGERYEFLTRLLQKLEATYPGAIQGNLISFNGIPTTTNMFLIKGGDSTEKTEYSDILKNIFEDSIFDFAGIRVVRRDDRYPEHPADGSIVVDGILEAVKDDNLTEDKEYFYGIWTFNKNNHFSVGKFIKGTPRDRILPNGVNFATADSRILPGVQRDENTKLIYNFQEKSGYVTFDSSGSGLHGFINDQTVLENFWSGDGATSTHNENVIQKSSGVKFDGQFDIIETTNIFDTSIIGSSHDDSHGLTVSFWLFRHQQSNDAWIIGSSSLSPSNDIGWAIGIKPNGNIGIKVNSDISNGFESIGSAVVPVKQWTMITLSIDSTGCCSMYMNGELMTSSFCPTGSSIDINTSTDEKIYIGAKPTDSGATWSGVDYFGSLAQINISNIQRDSNWIQSTYEQEIQIFNQSINSTESQPDNLQREVVLSWQIGRDFNFENGSVRIIRKYNEIPTHDTDGDEVLNQNANHGDFFFVDNYNFIHNGDYYYRIFTYNSIGNPCDRQESRLLPVKIPKSNLQLFNNDINPISDQNSISGNQKLLIYWTNSSEYRTKVFCSDEDFPILSLSTQGDLQISTGFEVYDGILSSFVHRKSGKNCDGSIIPLVNGKKYYYTLVNYNDFNQFSEPVYLSSIPSNDSSESFIPEEISDLHITQLNSKTLSIGWKNPTVKTSKLDLYMGETALLFVNIRDIFGGEVLDLNKMEIKCCTTIKKRNIKSSETELADNNGINEFSDNFNFRTPCSESPVSGGRGGFGVPIDDNCNNDEAKAETIVLSSTVSSGLIKGVISHTNDRAILSRREGYIMNLRSQFSIVDPEDEQNILFNFYTEPVTVTFTHPIKITALNKRHKYFAAGCEINEEPRILDDVCTCNEALDKDPCKQNTFNGGYVGATQPYVCRIEIQYKGGSLPDGTPINVQLFEHNEDNTLSKKSTKTSIREGRYLTSAISEEELDQEGNPTGNIINKSVCDIEIKHPETPDWLDVYASVDFAGFLVDVVHEVRFINSLFIRTDISKPLPDGIDSSEQFANVWQVNPDDPFNPDANIPVPDGTLVKWELVKGRHGKDRPFYSTQILPVLISGVYSSTTSGVARNVFLGPIGNLDKHIETITCRDEDGGLVSAETCCLSEEYEIHASVIIKDMTAKDAVKLAYSCEDGKTLTNRRFLLNAAENQPGSSPHWITWADGSSLLKFQIARNPALSNMLGADCFRNCVEAQIGGQLFEFPEGQIVQVTAPGEILWSVEFEEDPYTGELNPINYDSALPPNDEYDSLTIANIPITGETTDFYVRLNKFVDSANPKPKDCDSSAGGDGSGSGGENSDPCEWRNICNNVGSCSPTTGRPWENVQTIDGISTLIANNKEITLFGGGSYEEGIPPVYIGFKEPLDVRIIETRVNGVRVSDLVVDGVSIHTFVIEVTFAGKPVPDGTKISLSIEGSDQDIILLSSNEIYTNQINDSLINPTGETRSLAFFSINPIPNITFGSKINLLCTYDKLGTVDRQIKRCIEISNNANTSSPNVVPPDSNENPLQNSATSNEQFVYDTIDDVYVSAKGSKLSRMGHFVSSSPLSTVDVIYHFGGFVSNDNGNSGITAISEIFNTNTSEWSFTADIPTPRCFGMCVRKNKFIYCIGGIELDPLLSQYKVSRKIEYFDTESETWNSTLSPMTENYGIAYGDAQVIDEYIYITCGTTTIIDNSKPGNINERILRYSILNDSWDIIEPSNINLYKRIAPFGFYRNSTSHVSESSLNIIAPSSDIGYEEETSQIWNSGSLVFGYDSEDIEMALRWPINISSGTEITSAILSFIATPNTGSGFISGVVNLIDISNISDQVWSSGDGPIDSSYSINTQFSLEVTSPQVVSIDITDLIRNYILRSDFVSGNYVGIKIDWNGLRSIALTWDITIPTLSINYEVAPKNYYLYGGSLLKSPTQIQTERTNLINKLLNQFRSFILTSNYYLNLSPEEQNEFITSKEEEIINSVIIPAFIYPISGFKFKPGSEYFEDSVLKIDIHSLDDEWRVAPKPRDMGKCVYISHQDIAYFIGGSNQNNSTTLNRVDAIDLSNNSFERRKNLGRGRAMFGAALLGDEIYISGGLTSGHTEGWVQIDVQQLPEFVEATGTQTGGILVTLKDDSGEVIQDDIRINVKGQIRIPEIDAVLVEYLANRAADRALGGDGSGNAPDLPNEGDSLDEDRLQDAQNSIIDPNSDEFQFNAARKLNEDVTLFPVVYSRNDFFVQSGIGGTTLLSRSEDPLADFTKLSEFVKQITENSPPNENEIFDGNLTREELSALGDTLSSVSLPPIIINSGYLRSLYDIETIVTVLDQFYFGQTVSEFDLQIQERINDRIEELLDPPDEEDDGDGEETIPNNVPQKECYTLEHSSQPEIPGSDTPPGSTDPNNPSGTGGFSQSGQCLFCESILPLNASSRKQNSTVLTKFYNTTDWLPQINNHFDGNVVGLSDLIEEISSLRFEVPFGSSQLYNSLKRSAILTTGEEFDEIKKIIYVVSDNSQNLSFVSRSDAIDEVNSIDGDKNTPVIYTVFSTSFPLSLSALSDRSETGDVAKITEETGGQSMTLISSGFIDQILNLAMGSSTGGLGYGVYNRRIDFGTLSIVTAMTTNFMLPVNTKGFIRFRYSEDGFNFNSYSEKFEDSGTFNFNDFFAKIVDIEVTLSTGFTTDVTEEYDTSSTGVPKLISIVFETSSEKEDFIFLNKEDIITNAQQVAIAFEGDVSTSSIVEVGVATSESVNWSDFQNSSRPSMIEFGKTFIVDRSKSENSVVRNEILKTEDNILYSTEYGPWDPTSVVEIFYTKNNVDVQLLTGFKLFPREGEIYFDTKQSPEIEYKIVITNNNQLRVGLRLRNKLHTDNINVVGVGYIYSTNNQRPPALSQVAPSAINVTVSPNEPNSNDTFFALYDFKDLNNNKESESIISWYKNGSQLFEIQNKLTWTNNDLLLTHKLVPGDKIQFSVTPSDGIDYGRTVFSTKVEIKAQPPTALNVRIIPTRNGIINDRYDTSSDIKVEYSFSVDDSGPNAIENGTNIRWIVNGTTFKEGTFVFGQEDPYFDPKVILASEIINGTSAHIIGNQIQVEVTPRTSIVSGETVRSSSVTVQNSRPIVSDIQITPLVPTSSSTLLLRYTIDDRDITIRSQQNQSEIKWFNSSGQISEFVEITELRNSETVPAFYLRTGDRWKVEIKPYDGLDTGETVVSNIITIN